MAKFPYHILIVFLIVIGHQSLAVSESLPESAHGDSEEEPPFPSLDEQVVRSVVKWPHYPDALRHLAKSEFQMYDLMKGTARELKGRLAEVEHWIEDFEDSSLKGTTHLRDEGHILEEIFSHPLMGLRMIRRYAKLNTFLRDHTRKRTDKEDDLKSFISGMESDLSYGGPIPDHHDYNRAMDLVINLQYAQDLNAGDLINGKIGAFQTPVGLTPLQAHDLALRAEETGNFTESISWIRALLELDPNHLDHNFQEQLELDADRVAQKHAALLDKITEENYWDNLHRFWVTDDDDEDESDWPSETLKQRIVASEGFWTAEDPREEVVVLRSLELCAGRGPEIKRAKLVCYTDSARDAYWLIAPLKIEVHSWDPYVVQIYDVIRDKKMAYLRALSASNSELSVTEPLTPRPDQTSRLHVTTFGNIHVGTLAFEYNSTVELRSLLGRIGTVTGLEVEAGPEAVAVNADAVEMFRITSYSYGGTYAPHPDSLPREVPLIVGDRIATFMIYLTDVALGGGTVFPLLGIAVQPVKGSALYWMNLYRNGSTDWRTVHTACPVVLGQKWIANTWIRSVASFLKRPCTLNQYE